ncbi:MAG: hypothetical protein ACOYJ8_00445 [Patescibacteria group bacterium]|jgi:hypothetical protein
MSAAKKERLAPLDQYPIIEIKPSGIPPEMAGHIEEVKKAEHDLIQPIQDDQTGQTLVTSSKAQDPKVVLPLSLEEYEQGLRTKIEDSWRWLAEWSKRLVKIFGAQVGFKEQS